MLTGQQPIVGSLSLDVSADLVLKHIKNLLRSFGCFSCHLNIETSEKVATLQNWLAL